MRSFTFLARPRRFLAPIFLLGGVLLSWSAAGCRSASSTFCNDKCDCEQNCSTAALDTCVKTNDDNAKLASDVGCGSQSDAFSSCTIGRATCISSKYDTGGCDTEFSKLNQCLLSAKCAFVGTSVHCL